MAGISLQELAAVAAVASKRSFRAAAVELNVSPSALSHSVTAVEQFLGVRLFNRTTRSVSLTEAGEQFLARVNPAMREIAGAVETVNQFKTTPSGLLRLNASEGGAERILPVVLGFMLSYPDIRVELVSDGRMVDIVAEGFDAGVRGLDAVPQDMVSLALGLEEEFVVAASPSYLQAHGALATPLDLSKHECIRVRMPSGAMPRWLLRVNNEEIEIDAPGRLILGSHRVAIQAAVAGAGLIYVVRRSITEELAAGQLILAFEWTLPFPGVSLYYPRLKLQSAGLAAFIVQFKVLRSKQLGIEWVHE